VCNRRILGTLCLLILTLRHACEGGRNLVGVSVTGSQSRLLMQAGPQPTETPSTTKQIPCQSRAVVIGNAQSGSNEKPTFGRCRQASDLRRPRDRRAISSPLVQSCRPNRTHWTGTRLSIVVLGRNVLRAQGGHRQPSPRERFIRAAGQDGFNRSASRRDTPRLSAYPARMKCPPTQSGRS